MHLLNLTDLRPTEARQLQRLVEQRPKVVQFQKYVNYGQDPKPLVLVLGRWKDLVGGINLNYLDREQVKELQEVLPDILAARNLKQRYWRGRRLSPDVFGSMYRTYKLDYITAVTPAKFQAAKLAGRPEHVRHLPKARPRPLEPERPTPPKQKMADILTKAAAEKDQEIRQRFEPTRPIEPEPEVPELPAVSEPEITEPEFEEPEPEEMPELGEPEPEESAFGAPAPFLPEPEEGEDVTTDVLGVEPRRPMWDRFRDLWRRRNR